MDLNDFIVSGEDFKINPSLDYVNHPRWINTSKKSDFFAWRMEVLAYLQNMYRNLPVVRKFEDIMKDNLIYNPIGFESDLTKESSDDFCVKVMVRPN